MQPGLAKRFQWLKKPTDLRQRIAHAHKAFWQDPATMATTATAGISPPNAQIMASQHMAHHPGPLDSNPTPLKIASNEDYMIEVVVLGCGSSENYAPLNVHRANHFAGKAQSSENHENRFHGPTQSYLDILSGHVQGNKRKSSSILVTVYPKKGPKVKIVKYLIDFSATSMAFLFEECPHLFTDLDAIIATHRHADASGGIQTLHDHFGHPRWSHLHFGQLPFFVDALTRTEMTTSHGYIVNSPNGIVKWEDPLKTNKFIRIVNRNNTNWHFDVTPFEIFHSRHSDDDKREKAMGFIIGDFIYASDFCEIPDYSWKIIDNHRRSLREGQYALAMLNMLRVQPHMIHNGIGEFIHAARRINARHTVPTQTSGDGISYRQWLKIWEAFGTQQFGLPFHALPKWRLSHDQWWYEWPHGDRLQLVEEIVENTQTKKKTLQFVKNLNAQDKGLSDELKKMGAEYLKKTFDWGSIHNLYKIENGDDERIVQNALDHINGYDYMSWYEHLNVQGTKPTDNWTTKKGFRVEHSYDGMKIIIG